MPRDFDDSVVSEYLDFLDGQVERSKIKILLLGPSVNSTEPAAELRKYIASKCKGSEHNIVWGERKELIEAFQRAIGKYGDLCAYELNLVSKEKEWVDALIIIPDSAGSLVELGMFSDKSHIHSRTLVLFSKAHNPHNKKKKDFISLGPKKAYENGRAFVKTVDYSEKELVWDIVNDFLSRMKAVRFSKHTGP